jgi:hypothetical protein
VYPDFSLSLPADCVTAPSAPYWRLTGHHHQLCRRRRNGLARVHRSQLLAARARAERTHHHAADSRADVAGAAAAGAGIDIYIDFLTKNSNVANRAPHPRVSGANRHSASTNKNDQKFFNSVSGTHVEKFCVAQSYQSLFIWRPLVESSPDTDPLSTQGDAAAAAAAAVPQLSAAAVAAENQARPDQIARKINRVGQLNPYSPTSQDNLWLESFR